MRTLMGVYVVVISFFLMSSSVQADDDTNSDKKAYQLQSKNEDRRISTLFSAEYQNLKNSNGATLSAYVLSATGVYALSRKWGLSLRIAQGFTSSGLGALFTAWGAYFTYALTGSPLISNEEVGVSGWDVVQATESSPSGLKIHLGLGQTIFSGSASSVTYTGMEGGIRYEFPSSSYRHYFLGLGFNQIGNGVNKITSFSFSGGVILWW